MSQRQIAAASMHADAGLDQKAPRALPVHRFSAAAHNSVRLWEWDCFAKYLLIRIFLHNSSQFNKFNHKSSTFYTLPCPALGMGLFRKIPNDPSQFYTIHHNSTHFDIFSSRPPTPRPGAPPNQHPKSNIQHPRWQSL